MSSRSPTHAGRHDRIQDAALVAHVIVGNPLAERQHVGRDQRWIIKHLVHRLEIPRYASPPYRDAVTDFALIPTTQRHLDAGTRPQRTRQLVRHQVVKRPPRRVGKHNGRHQLFGLRVKLPRLRIRFE